MTCRHDEDDPNCSGYEARVDRAKALVEKDTARKGVTPDARNFEIEEIREVYEHLVMKVRYPNCAKCSYEGNKVMVFLNAKIVDAIKWCQIDPHFRDPKEAKDPKRAPSPAARFPASKDGWADAVAYAYSKSNAPRLARQG